MLLAGLSTTLIYMFIINVFYENRIKYKKEDLLGILLIGLILLFGFKYNDIPSFIYYILEPMAIILVIRLTKKKITFDAIIGYFAILICAILADISVALVAAPLGYLEYLAALNYKASAVLYWLIPLGLLFTRKSFNQRYLTLSKQTKLRQEKYTLAIYFVHITILMLLYHTNYQVVLNGSYSGFEKVLYWLVIILYALFIYLQIIFYNSNLKKTNKKRFQQQSNALKSNLLSQSYALTHDLKNVIHLIDQDPVESIIRAKKVSAKNLSIDLKESTQAVLDFNTLDLSIVLSILLDNAIEHISGWPILPQWITLEMTSRLIKVSNPIKEYNVNRMTDYGYSSKSEASAGYGLTNALELVEKNGYQMTYSVEKKVLTCSITKKKL